MQSANSPLISGTEVDLCTILDPHTVTGLMKVHFREQRVSLIPRGQPLADIVQAVKARDVREIVFYYRYISRYKVHNLGICAIFHKLIGSLLHSSG